MKHGVDLADPCHKPYRWFMLALLWILYFSFGVVNRSPAPLITPMLKDLHMSYGQMGLVLGSWQLTYIGFAIFAGVIMDKWGIRKSIFAGALVIGLSATLRSLSTGFITLLMFVALFGIGGPMVSIGAPKTIAFWFRGKDRGIAVGTYTTGPWMGGIVALAATNGVFMPLTGYSWRLTFLCYGVIAFSSALVWWFFSKEAEQEDSPEPFDTIIVLLQLLKARNVRIILFSGLLAFSMMHGYTSWLPKILENAGFSPAAAGITSATPFLSSIPAALIIPRIVPQRFRGRTIALLAILASFSIMWVVATDLPPVIGLLLFGCTGACLFPLLVLIMMETPEVEARYLGSATGVFFCISEIGGFLGPFIVGFLVDLTGTFLPGSSFLAFLGLLIFGSMLLLKAHPSASQNERETRRGPQP